MEQQNRVSPTRSNLLRLREQLKQTRAGHALLEHKREVLVHQLLAMIRMLEATDADATQRFQAAYASLFEVRMRMGGDRVQWASLAHTAEIHTTVDLHSVMGVAVPSVQINVAPLPLPYSLGDTSAALDEARARWLSVAELLGHLAETVTAVWRLATELEKVQRRVNALEYVLIPQLEATLQYIAGVLDEQERGAFINAKRVKAGQARDPDGIQMGNKP